MCFFSTIGTTGYARAIGDPESIAGLDGRAEELASTAKTTITDACKLPPRSAHAFVRVLSVKRHCRGRFATRSEWSPWTALDANVLVRYLVDDHPQQAGAARKLTAELMSESRGFVCRDVSVEHARILDRAYGLSCIRIVIVFEERAATGGIHSEAADDTIWAADGYRRGGPDFAEQMIAAAAKRSSADIFYTLDRHDSGRPPRRSCVSRDDRSLRACDGGRKS